ncbi:MAG: carbamate kinase [candidate division WOR-3 bacterium]|jgi:carbamate kinase|nr:carbamate kinase [candidate division WOR-3 bacterium]MCR4424421.1 carbamate kinase [candidate division WOR-3 bacterium]MDH7518239.1 carbamate kinase [bacterium]
MSITVVAIGGNSLIRDKERSSFADQLATLKSSCQPIAEMVRRGERVLITHGNGPQVGFVLLRSHLARMRVPEIPLDAANAQTQAEIGYMIQQVLDNEFRQMGIERRVVTVVTQVVVDNQDPAFSFPAKPVGPFYTREEAVRLQRELGWVLKEDAGRGFRRFVPSPMPRAIVEIEEIKRLVEAGAVVVACGGGGIPVVEENGSLHGVAAVIDKDLASALLGNLVGAERLVISTAVAQVYLHYGMPDAQPLTKVTAAEMAGYLAAGHFPEGSMGPKVSAGLNFLKNGGKEVFITDPEHILAAVEGKAGTTIVP